MLIQHDYLHRVIVEGGVVNDVDLPTDHRATKMLLKSNIITHKRIASPKKRKRLLNGKLDFSKLYESEKLMKNFKDYMNKEVNYKQLNSQLANNELSIDEVVDKITTGTKLISSKVLPKQQNRIDPDWYKLNKQRIDKWICRKNELWKNHKADLTSDYLCEQYKSYKTYFRSMLREIQEKYWNNYFISLRAAHDAGRSNQFYKLMKQCMGIKVKTNKGGKRGVKGSVFDENGNILYKKCEVLSRWRNYFDKLLNHSSTMAEDIDQYLPDSVNEPFSELDEPFTIAEVVYAILKCKNNKAAGPDNLVIECSKIMIRIEKNDVCEVTEYATLITTIINKMMDEGVVPSIWKDVIIAVVPKGGDNRVCENNRGISLQSHMGKVIESVIETRLNKYIVALPNGINETQYGGMNGKSTEDASFISTLMTESAMDRGVIIYKCYIDLVKAYDRVNRKVLFKILERRGVPLKILNLIKALHYEVKARVRIDGELTEPFQLGAGLKQGGVLSVLLWSIYMGAIVEKVHKEFIIYKIQGIPIIYNPRSDIFKINKSTTKKNRIIKYINEVLFVDDIVEFSPTKAVEQEKLIIWNRVLGRFQQEMSIPKTNVMCTGSGIEIDSDIKVSVNGVDLKLVDKFKYSMNSEFNPRKKAMKYAFREYQLHIFSNRHLSITSRLNLYSVLVLSAMLHGSSLWGFKRNQMDKLESMHFSHLRYIIPGMTRASSFEDLIIVTAANKFKVAIMTIEAMVTKRKLRYAGHIERMNDNEIQRIMLHGEIDLGGRTVGRPLLGYRSSLKAALKLFGIDSSMWSNYATDKVGWKNIINKVGCSFYMKEWLRIRKTRSDNRHTKRDVIIDNNYASDNNIINYDPISDNNNDDDESVSDENSQDDDNDKTLLLMNEIEMGYECDDEKYDNDNENIRNTNLSVTPINLWHSGTTYRENEVYNIWKVAFENINSDRRNEYGFDNIHPIIEPMINEVNVTEENSIGTCETATVAKRSRRQSLNPENEIDSYWRTYATKPNRMRRNQGTQCTEESLDGDAPDQIGVLRKDNRKKRRGSKSRTNRKRHYLLRATSGAIENINNIRYEPFQNIDQDGDVIMSDV